MDLTYHKEILKKYPEDTWVKPKNYNCNDFSVFADLFEYGLCERKIEDRFRGKTFIGNTVYFKYNLLKIKYHETNSTI